MYLCMGYWKVGSSCTVFVGFLCQSDDTQDTGVDRISFFSTKYKHHIYLGTGTYNGRGELKRQHCAG